MKFMDGIQTTEGPGLVVAAMPGGQVLAAMARPSAPHMVFAWCEPHQVWYLASGDCPACCAERQTAQDGKVENG